LNSHKYTRFQRATLSSPGEFERNPGRKQEGEGNSNTGKEIRARAVRSGGGNLSTSLHEKVSARYCRPGASGKKIKERSNSAKRRRKKKKLQCYRRVMKSEHAVSREHLYFRARPTAKQEDEYWGRNTMHGTQYVKRGRRLTNEPIVRRSPEGKKQMKKTLAPLFR